MFGYEISQSKIGWKTIIVVDNATLTKCHIGRRNSFVGPMGIMIKEDASIGSMNSFSCGWWATEKQYENRNYERSLLLEKNSLITSDHYVDVVGSFTLAKESWIAGKGSQFWTHGAGVSDRNIVIGENCYVGSAVRFAPGSSIGHNTLVGLGSIITKKFTSVNVIIAGQPAKVIRENYNWKTQDNI